MSDGPSPLPPPPCRVVEDALASENADALAQARRHAETCDECRRELQILDAIAATARAMHREWDSPDLWRTTSAAMRALQGEDARQRHMTSASRAWWNAGVLWRMTRPAASLAAILILAIGVLSWFVWQAARPAPQPIAAADTQERLLDEQALAAIEKAESDYANAIDALARRAAEKSAASSSPLIANLRERLQAIDAAIADCRAEIVRNRFNAHVRRQLLFMYQEKRHTLEQILESDPNAL